MCHYRTKYKIWGVKEGGGGGLRVKGAGGFYVQDTRNKKEGAFTREGGGGPILKGSQLKQMCSGLWKIRTGNGPAGGQGIPIKHTLPLPGVFKSKTPSHSPQ